MTTPQTARSPVPPVQMVTLPKALGSLYAKTAIVEVIQRQTRLSFHHAPTARLDGIKTRSNKTTAQSALLGMKLMWRASRRAAHVLLATQLLPLPLPTQIAHRAHSCIMLPRVLPPALHAL